MKVRLEIDWSRGLVSKQIASVLVGFNNNRLIIIIIIIIAPLTIVSEDLWGDLECMY